MNLFDLPRVSLQKGIVALLSREEDMPFTKSGMRPTILFNSHGLPTRMTIATYLEMMMGNICARKGTNVDCTIFKKCDIESMANELEKLGLHRYGYERMMHGMTGEYIDSLIFFGPVYYQRLQKFIADAEYSVRHAATDAVTMQAADSGRSGGGGLKLGEMEKDVICSHGAMLTLMEKFFNHSDGYTEYICRCGKPPIVNHTEKLYKCTYCGDNADIVAVPTSWSSKLFMQEMMTANVGIRRIPRPFVYEVYKDDKRDADGKSDQDKNDKTRITQADLKRENFDTLYNAEVIKQLGIMIEDAQKNDEEVQAEAINFDQQIRDLGDLTRE